MRSLLLLAQDLDLGRIARESLPVVGKRKLQIFVSSTYEDLIDERLAAIEAILAAGHIPAAMEQFSAGDETAWEKIKVWIDESDAFLLIVGGRYGSIEPMSGKSYVQLEYEYAQHSRKPYFAVVVSPAHHEQRVKSRGLGVDERQHPVEYAAFKLAVTQKLCRYWEDRKDIKAAILQKLPEWAQRDDLIGWVRGTEAATASVANELARLSQENHALRVAGAQDSFDGLQFDELARLLRQHRVDDSHGATEATRWLAARDGFPLPWAGPALHAGHLFEALHDALSRWLIQTPRDYQQEPDPNRVMEQKALGPLISHGLATLDKWYYELTPLGRRFRSRMLLRGDLEQRLGDLWTDAPPV